MLNIEKIKNLNNIADPKVRKETKLNVLYRIEKARKNNIKNNFLDFVKYIWPDFIEGFHHKEVADKFNRLQTKEITNWNFKMYKDKFKYYNVCTYQPSVISFLF